MGVVALAHDERLERRVAIKLIKPDLFALPDMRTFFDNEARAMARVSHTNVIHVYAFGYHGSVPYFVMEYVEGTTVESWLRARPPNMMPDLDEAVRILDQACLGVEAIPRVEHRPPRHQAVEPAHRREPAASASATWASRAFWSRDSSEKQRRRRQRVVHGARGCARGRRRRRRPRRSPRDIYALGCLAYELFTGRPPFLGATDMNVLSQHVLQEAACRRARIAPICRAADRR